MSGWGALTCVKCFLSDGYKTPSSLARLLQGDFQCTGCVAWLHLVDGIRAIRVDKPGVQVLWVLLYCSFSASLRPGSLFTEVVLPSPPPCPLFHR
jgi:hypothetical protein